MNKIQTKSQFDKPYNSVTSQCSWFCVEIVKHLVELLDAIEKMNTIKYKNIIEKCLEKATENRSKYYKYDLGENIDQVDNNNNYEYYICKSSISIEDFQSFVPEVKVLKRNYPVLSEKELEEKIIKYLPINKYIIINKHGESFVVAFITHNRYIIIDSHKSEHIICDINMLMKYILDDYYGFYYILIGFFKHDNELEKYIDILITDLNNNITSSYSLQKKLLPSTIDDFIFSELNGVKPENIKVLHNNKIIMYEQIFKENIYNIKINYC